MKRKQAKLPNHPSYTKLKITQPKVGCMVRVGFSGSCRGVVASPVLGCAFLLLVGSGGWSLLEQWPGSPDLLRGVSPGRMKGLSSPRMSFRTGGDFATPVRHRYGFSTLYLWTEKKSYLNLGHIWQCHVIRVRVDIIR